MLEEAYGFNFNHANHLDKVDANNWISRIPNKKKTTCKVEFGL